MPKGYEKMRDAIKEDLLKKGMSREKAVMSGLPLNQIIHGDCLEVMRQFPDKSIDMILCDLPYGVTGYKWDTIIPFEPLWEQYERIIKDNGAIVLTAIQPFTSALIMSNIKRFKYCWVWDKKKPGVIGIAKYQPLRYTEDIVVFCKGSSVYNPQMVKRNKVKKSRNYRHEDKIYTEKFPSNIIEISNANQKGKVHPTQKPVALFEYLIKTYTNEGEIVLDNCIGSGTTAIACINTGRNFIGIEIEEKYVKIARERIEKHKKLDKMRLFPISELEAGKLQYKGLYEPEDEADKEAKRIAAATWNKKHPKSPVTNKSHKKK